MSGLWCRLRVISKSYHIVSRKVIEAAKFHKIRDLQLSTAGLNVIVALLRFIQYFSDLRLGVVTVFAY